MTCAICGDPATQTIRVGGGFIDNGGALHKWEYSMPRCDRHAPGKTAEAAFGGRQAPDMAFCSAEFLKALGEETA